MARIFKKGEQVVHKKHGKGVVVDLADGHLLLNVKFDNGSQKIVYRRDIEETDDEKAERESNELIKKARIRYERKQREYQDNGYPENYNRNYTYPEVLKVAKEFDKYVTPGGYLINIKELIEKGYDMAVEMGRSIGGILGLVKRIYFGWDEGDPKQNSATIDQVRDDLGIRPVKPSSKTIRLFRFGLLR